MNKRRELVVGDKNSTFTLYRDYADVGAEMKQDFFESEYTLKEDARRYIFKISKANENEGILGLSYGTFLMSVFLDRFSQEANFSLEEKEKLENSIIELLSYVDANGFDLSPFGRPEDNKMLFGWGDNKQSFIESLTWALSCFLYARRLSKDGVLDNLNNYIGDITKMIAKCLGILLDNVVCANGEIGYKEGRDDYVGWGPITGCTESSLYFTHSVCETFGDIEDTMLGNKELGIAKDIAYIEEIASEYEKMEGTKKVKGNIVELFEKVCKCVGKNLYEKYESSLGKNFFYVDGSEVTSIDQIAYSLQSPVLLNQLYVVLSLIYVNFHKDMKEKGEDIFKDFGATLKNAVDMVYETYVSLENKGKQSIVNREYATFTEKHPDIRYRQYFSSERINVAILETLIIKAKAMIVTYVTKYPEREIGEVLNILDKTRSKSGGWLWNDVGYDLQYTERCISAIREFYDYYDSFQKTPAGKLADYDTLTNMYEEKYVRQAKELEEVKKNYRQQLEVVKLQYEANLNDKIEEVKSSYKLESVVREIVEEQIRTSFVELLTGSMERIAEDNKNAVTKSTLGDDDKKVKSALAKLFTSYLTNYTISSKRPAGISSSWRGDSIVSVMKEDLHAFIKEWMTQVCLKNTSNSELDTQVLSQIFNDKQKDR